MIRSTGGRAVIALLFSAGSASADSWVAAWGAAPDEPGPSFAKQTLRQVVRTSIAGSSVRIRLSNLYGKTPVTLGPVRVAAHAGGGAVRPGTDRGLTFGGKPSVTIAPGASALSDAAPFDVAALQELAVSLYVPDATGPSTSHTVGMQNAYVARGDQTSTAALTGAEPDGTRYFLTDVEVAAAADARTLVVVGDSVSDGVGSTDDANARWPDALAARLQADARLKNVAVVNSGLAGNRILKDGAEPYLGPSTLKRFDRDALDKPGVRWVVLLQGINDISATQLLPGADQKVTAEEIVEGMKTLIGRAHGRGVKVFGATLLPRAGARGSRPHTPAGEVMRVKVNEWIRTGGGFDAVVDFEAVMRDPARPTFLRADFDSGDGTHPNDAGYRAMADAFDLA
ncbi:MAG: SGNH/GDSL hydrolase family protein, partial [Vicinamibacteria bacterium]